MHFFKEEFDITLSVFPVIAWIAPPPPAHLLKYKIHF